MPRYFIHFDDVGSDPEGTELPDIAAARRETILSAREILAGAIVSGAKDVPMRFLITDADGRLLDTVQTWEVLPIALRSID